MALKRKSLKVVDISAENINYRLFFKFAGNPKISLWPVFKGAYIFGRDFVLAFGGREGIIIVEGQEGGYLIRRNFRENKSAPK